MLESKERKIQQDPKKIMDILALKQTDIVADLGCGSGYFTVPIAQKVDKVYAIDVQQEMLDVLEQKIRKQRITNIELLLSKQTNLIPLQTKSTTVLLTVNTLHEFQDKEQMANEIQRVLKPHGKLAIIDFKKKDNGSGPPISIRVSQQQAIQLFEKKGLTFAKAFDLKSNYMLVFQK
jgi:ubiquinone/menaquinone biosynthesis C-methylase UbiE